jgi:hypothetical protein
MSLTNIVSGDYGQTIQLTVLDTDTSSAADISVYSTTQKMVFRNPAGTESEKTAAFYTDGSDGIVEYALVDGDISTAGNWRVRVEVTSATAVLTSTWLAFIVLE